MKADQLGGVQEKSLRAGTESVPLIVGMAKALELTKTQMPVVENYFAELKRYLVDRLKEIKGIGFNANTDKEIGYLPSVLNISLDKQKFNEMTLFSLDLNGIAVSGGSACSSGAIKGSHVLENLDPTNDTIALRISFSKYTTKEELNYLVDTLASL